ncbi:hypothetical protein QZH41_006868 [Actinostola sp. cb2023]|nr:hypothetical protein QZH41_006868 [Actinostola sp. cb2023]
MEKRHFIFTEGGKLEYPEKNPRSKGENELTSSTRMKRLVQELNQFIFTSTPSNSGTIEQFHILHCRNSYPHPPNTTSDVTNSCPVHPDHKSILGRGLKSDNSLPIDGESCEHEFYKRTKIDRNSDTSELHCVCAGAIFLSSEPDIVFYPANE